MFSLLTNRCPVGVSKLNGVFGESDSRLASVLGSVHVFNRKNEELRSGVGSK